MSVRFHPLARREMMIAARRYERERSGLGDAFLDQVAACIRLLRLYPRGFPIISGPYRRVRTNRFPYGLVYVIAGSAEIEIIAVAHGKRRPGYWRRRGV